MYISVNTVAFHMRQIFRKLDIGSRLELARIVMQQAHQPHHHRLEAEIFTRPLSEAREDSGRANVTCCGHGDGEPVSPTQPGRGRRG
jgi:hypothetical protein